MMYKVEWTAEHLRDYDVRMYDDPRDVAESITERLGDDPYDNMLDECYPEVDICGYKYAASVALYRTDEVAYRCGQNDYYDSIAQDIAYDVNRMGIGESITEYDFTITALADDEEDEEM